MIIQNKIDAPKPALDSFSFKIDSPYAPRTFTQDDDCIFAGSSFSEIAREHFQQNTILYLALIEDRSKNSGLFDLAALRQWYGSKAWSSNEFKNPKTGQLCERIRILGIDKLGGVFSLATYPSMSSFRYLTREATLETTMLTLKRQREALINGCCPNDIGITGKKAVELLLTLPPGTLRTLDLSSTNIENDDLRELMQKQPNLEKIDLGDTNISDLGLKHIYNNQSHRLQDLYLGYTRVTNRGIADLYTALEFLPRSNTRHFKAR